MPRKRKGNPVHGWVNFHKPLGMTSTQAVGKVRWLFSAQKAGHAGTLDPLASGVLPIALGEATKTVPFMVDAAKSYEFEITWGESRDTIDAEGAVIARSDIRPCRADIEAALPAFIGAIDQIPPRFSAIKVDGQRAYDLARAGEDVKLKPRKVKIDNIEILSATADTLRLSVDCGKGTYIRSLARDLAGALGAEGYVSELIRTRVGPFKLSAAQGLDFIEQSVHKRGGSDSLLAVETALDDIPVLAITADQRDHLRQGRAIAPPQTLHTDAKTGLCLALCERQAVALCEKRDGQLWPRRVFQM